MSIDTVSIKRYIVSYGGGSAGDTGCGAGVSGGAPFQGDDRGGGYGPNRAIQAGLLRLLRGPLRSGYALDRGRWRSALRARLALAIWRGERGRGEGGSGCCVTRRFSDLRRVRACVAGDRRRGGLRGQGRGGLQVRSDRTPRRCGAGPHRTRRRGRRVSGRTRPRTDGAGAGAHDGALPARCLRASRAPPFALGARGGLRDPGGDLGQDALRTGGLKRFALRTEATGFRIYLEKELGQQAMCAALRVQQTRRELSF